MKRVARVTVEYTDGETEDWHVDGHVRVHKTELVKEDSDGKKTTLPCRWIGLEAVVRDA